jgi:serine phosphatase RsbU (regulator of sigma subunit)
MRKILYAFTALLMVAGCQNRQQAVNTCKYVDSVVEKACIVPDLDRALALTDSFLDLGMMTEIQAAKLRAEAYLQVNKMDEAEEQFNLGANATPRTAVDSFYWFCCSCLQIQYETVRRDQDAVLRKALPLLEIMKDITYDKEYENEMLMQKIMLYLSVGNSQISLERIAEAAKSYEQCYDAVKELIRIEYSFGALYNATMCVHNIANAYFDLGSFDEADIWMQRTDSLFNMYMGHPKTPDSYKDVVKAYVDYDHAMLACGQGKTAEADRYYREVLKSNYAKSEEIQYRIVNLLMHMGRYAEAADRHEAFDNMIAKYHVEPTVDMIYLVKYKFEAYYKAGRRDSALAAAAAALEFVDSAIVRQKRSEAAKLATIYETKLKDEEIAQQQITLNRQRSLALVVVLVLITAFFIVYTLFRRRAARRMALMKARQERIESELRIARNIQMSMVPSTFPEYEGLDLYAQMTPAKEVGGDLYGYVVHGSRLYFTVGDVSGKGVPASLFMAQATRLFRTLANQGLMPTEICNSMNAELSGDDNTNGMFVTMFIGMLDLENGHLAYCNAGHNPPVLGGGDNQGDFLEMIPNAPIGLWPEMDYEGEEIASIKGRALFVYTDGLNEAEDLGQRQFGDERLLDVLRHTHFDSAQQVVETLHAKVEEHRNGAEPNDDLTMLCLRVS